MSKMLLKSCDSSTHPVTTNFAPYALFFHGISTLSPFPCHISIWTFWAVLASDDIVLVGFTDACEDGVVGPSIINLSNLFSQVEKAVKEGKKILFTGHSSGGAIASLATLWVLDGYTRKQNIRIPIGCVTFGSPLIGDGTLTHAVRREKWTGHFTHFVMEHDIVPRMMLAPKTSIQEHLPNILKFFQQKVNPITTQKSLKLPKIFNKKDPEKTIDHDQLLPSEDQDLAQFALESLTENLSYEELNKNGLHWDKRVYLKDLNEHLLTSNGTTGAAVRTSNKALFELREMVSISRGRSRKEWKKVNEDEIKESMRKYKSNKPKNNIKPKIIEDLTDEILKYKQKHGDGPIDYYEAFKLQDDLQNDFVANVNRLEQAKIWDVIVEMVMRKDLPDEFEVWDELVKLGTQFRRLYEPLDIANYYRHLKGDGYLGVRPKRYFVAEVEELMKEVIKPTNKTIEQVVDSVHSHSSWSMVSILTSGQKASNELQFELQE
ncbi:hypothetical protein L1987_08340 [Smallanthus sonchifolius]|uniref:Uncharacterized protein n=1 Tax=Smallanthus sonchifolius TaxID=185202 RepID=A0ACB9JKC5_9ASTR|nr:hypothetical protein L1987_08340 [Smallanthus sonchifolius]